MCNSSTSTLADVYYNSGSATYSFIIANLSTLSVNGGSGDDTFYADFTLGTMLPSGGTTFDGGANGANGDSLRVVGQTSADAFGFSSTQVAHTSPATANIAYTNTETLDFDSGTFTASSDVGAAHSLTLESTAKAVFTTNQHLNALTINTGGLATVAQNGGRLLVVKALSLVGTGTLDLYDNDMIVDYASGSPLTSITNWIRAARTGTWTEPG